MIPLEGAVHDRGSDFQHQMSAPRRPTHLLLSIHPAMQQPLHRAFGDRGRDRFLASPGLRIVDDDIGLPGHVCLEFNQEPRHLARRRSRRRDAFRRGLQRCPRFGNEIQSAFDRFWQGSRQPTWLVGIGLRYRVSTGRRPSRMRCMECGSSAVSERPERTIQGYRRFRCRACGKQFNERSTGLLN
jgi:DNA-directed RNA polymerase subunit RPC12/RpoP